MYQCICIDADNGPASGTFRSKVVKGRKDYRCCECSRPLPKGTIHHADTGLWDGGWDTYRTCMLCAQVRKDFMECGYTYGELWMELREALMDGEDYDFEDENGWCWLDPPKAAEQAA